MENTDKYYVSKINNSEEERDELGVLLSVQVAWTTTREYSFDGVVQTVFGDFSVRFSDDVANLPPNVILSETEITQEFLMTCVQYLIDTDESIKLTVGREIYDKHFMSDLIPDLIPAPPPSMLLPFRRIPPFRTPPINVLPDPIEN